MKSYLLSLFVLFFCLQPVAGQNVFVVNSVLDHTDANPGDGQCLTMFEVCTLRAAIEEANETGNALAGPDEIHFSSSLAVPVLIKVGRNTGIGLPEITDDLVLDGTTSSGARVIIDSDSSQWVGLILGAGSAGSTIRGLVIVRAHSGIIIGSDDNLIENNLIGVSPTGESMGHQTGVSISDVSGNVIRNNVVAANNSEITVAEVAENTVIESNRIGVDLGGNWHTNTIAITDFGIATRIGGQDPAQGNLVGGSVSVSLSALGREGIISNNYFGVDESGVKLSSGNATGIEVTGDLYTILDNVVGFQETFVEISDAEGIVFRRNYIGTDEMERDLAVSVPGLINVGLTVSNSESVVFGGRAGDQGNIIANIRGNAIEVINSALCTFQGNFIGTNRDRAKLGNDGHGILIKDSSFGNVFGYAATDVISSTQYVGNTIAYNGGSGLVFEDAPGTHNSPIRGNRIYDNALIGIDLNADGVTPNDPNDADEGSNFTQNYPVIMQSGYDETTHTIGVMYGIDASNTHVTYPLIVDAYLADDSNSGEGKTYLGTHTYLLPESSPRFDIPADGLDWDADDVLVLTATDPFGNTSEFSEVSEPLGTPPSLVSTEEMNGLLPANGYALSSAFPNPFNPQTTLTLEVGQQQSVAITVHDLLGRQVALLHDGLLSAFGSHTFTFEAEGLASGTYILRVAGEHFVETRNLLLLK